MPVPELLATQQQPLGHYVLSCSCELAGGVAAGWLSPDTDDPIWDAFLERTSQGHFQQSSMWAAAKAIDGWRVIRIVLTWNGEIAGGFQILYRRTRLGGYGYISKGPVLVPNEPAMVEFLIRLVIRTVKANRLRALILQPPDESPIDERLLAGAGFLLNHLHRVISATLVYDVAGGADEIKKRMRLRTRAQVKVAEKRGLTIREGGEQDVGMFFRLMAATCERQQVMPNPATETAMRQLWTSFKTRERIQLIFAEFRGTPIAGALCIRLGDRMTVWKKGWSGEHKELNPNHLVMFEAMLWAHQQGCKRFDCAGLDRGIATKMLRGEPLSEAQEKSRDRFNLGFGGIPALLPESRVYIDNPLVRILYRLVTGTIRIRNIGRQLMRREKSR